MGILTTDETDKKRAEEQKADKKKEEKEDELTCPECGGEMFLSNGCETCHDCGYSPCSI